MKKTKSAGVVSQDYAMVSIADLKPHPRNPRKGDVGEIAASIETNGFFGAIVAQQSTGYILVGNHRFLAAKEKGLEFVPVLWADVDDAAALRILLVDNRTAEKASWDYKSLAELLESVISDCGDLDGTGFDREDLDQIIADIGNTEMPDPVADDGGSEPAPSKTHICPRCSYEWTD